MVVGNKRGNDETIFRIDNESNISYWVRLNKYLVKSLPYPVAKFSAKVLQLLPTPLLTEDQLKLLKYDNCRSKMYKCNFDIGFESKKKFENEINKYSYNWKSGGQFAINN